ncbi:hypothetical protein RAS2_32320 [Phycisphaerae bacterium RAS2]|nr:hypothetical protein RAS2_32320 [Phycisphaerae bacterium RAS2]
MNTKRVKQFGLVVPVYSLILLSVHDVRAQCGQCYSQSQTFTNSTRGIEVDSMLTYTNCWIDLSISSAHTRASSFYVNELSGLDCGEPWECSSADYDSDADFDSGWAAAANSSSSPIQPCPLDVSTGGGAMSYAAGGGVNVDVGSHLQKWEGHHTIVGNCTCPGDQTMHVEGLALAMSSSGGGASSMVVFEEPCGTIGMASTVRFYRNYGEIHATCSGSSSTSTLELIEVSFVEIVVEGGGDVSRKHGVLAEVYDPVNGYSTITLGSLFSSCSSTGWDGNTWTLECVDALGKEGYEYASLSVNADAFPRHDGDINGDGNVCPDDEDMMKNLTGAVEIEQTGYTPRADFDLDGVISANDRDVFEGIYDDLPDENENDIPDACE